MMERYLCFVGLRAARYAHHRSLTRTFWSRTARTARGTRTFASGTLAIFRLQYAYSNLQKKVEANENYLSCVGFRSRGRSLDHE
jgi:hypothetical protein